MNSRLFYWSTVIPSCYIIACNNLKLTWFTLVIHRLTPVKWDLGYGLVNIACGSQSFRLNESRHMIRPEISDNDRAVHNLCVMSKHDWS